MADVSTTMMTVGHVQIQTCVIVLDMHEKLLQLAACMYALMRRFGFQAADRNQADVASVTRGRCLFTGSQNPSQDNLSISLRSQTRVVPTVPIFVHAELALRRCCMLHV